MIFVSKEAGARRASKTLCLSRVFLVVGWSATTDTRVNGKAKDESLSFETELVPKPVPNLSTQKPTTYHGGERRARSRITSPYPGMPSWPSALPLVESSCALECFQRFHQPRRMLGCFCVSVYECATEIRSGGVRHFYSRSRIALPKTFEFNLHSFFEKHRLIEGSS